MARSKPYARPSPPRQKSNNEAAGSWKHDLHSTSQSLASRLSPTTSSSTRPSLLARISTPGASGNGNRNGGGRGTELLPSLTSTSSAPTTPGLYGFGTQPPANTANANSALELLPGRNARKAGPLRGVLDPQNRSLVQSGLDAALGRGGQRVVRQPVVLEPVAVVSGVSILGAGRATTVVRVENLAPGTTADDVVSAFAPVPIISAHVSSATGQTSITIDVELQSRQQAEELVGKYDGVVADGNTLAVSILKPALAERMAATSNNSGLNSLSGLGGGVRKEQPRELLTSGSTGKMYSDSILATNPRTNIITLAEDERAEAYRANAWQKTGSSLAERVGNGRRY